MPSLFFVAPSGWRKLYADKASPSVQIENAETLVTTVPDDAAREVCSRAGLPFFEVTAAFRAQAKGEKLFYDFDAHFTADGNRLFSTLSTPIVAGQIP